MESPLGPEAMSVLRQIGEALDDRRPVEVQDHGLVALGEAPSTDVREKSHGKGQGQGGPAAGSRSRAARGQGKAHGKAAPRSRLGGLRAAYEGQLGRLEEAYPSLKVHADDHGMWLEVQSSVLEGLDRKATFLVALPFLPSVGPIAWAFWDEGGCRRWIGPRHTNFFNGSICAFAPSDGAWAEGGDLRTLIDLYSAWAFRHLHLEVLGRWPGRQHALAGNEPYYRRMEFGDDDLCSCPSGRRYAKCCKPSDMLLNGLVLKSAFEAQMGRPFKDRAPQRKVVAFLEGRGPLPAIRQIHLNLSNSLIRQRRSPK